MKSMKNIKPLFTKILITGFLLSVFIFTFMGNPVAQPTAPVSILQLVEHPALDQCRKGIEMVLTEAKVPFQFESAQNNPGLAAQIAQKFVGAKSPVLVGIGTTATQALVSADKDSQIPIVFSAVTDPVGAGLVKKLNKPEGYITGVSDAVDTNTQFIFFKTLFPNLTRLGIVYNPGEANSALLVEQMRKMGPLYGFNVFVAPANNSAEVASATQNLIGKVDAIFINNDNTALSAFETITRIANANRTPVLVSDVDMIEHGALAALGPNQLELGKATGQMILWVLRGDKIENIPVVFPLRTELQFNLKVAQQLGLQIPASLVNRASKVIQ